MLTALIACPDSSLESKEIEIFPLVLSTVVVKATAAAWAAPKDVTRPSKKTVFVS